MPVRGATHHIERMVSKMSLKLNVETLDAIPESLRPLYKEDGGKFRLELEGYEDPVGLKSALQKERDAARAANKQASAWAALGKTPEEIQALVDAQRKADEDKLKGAGEFDKLRTQMADQHKTELSKKDEVVGKMRANLERYLVDAQATAAIAELKGSARLLMPHVKAQVKVIEEGEGFVIRVVDDNGTPRVNGNGQFLSIKDLVSEMRSGDEFSRAFEPTGTTGSGAASRPASGSRTITQSQFNALPPKERAKAMASGVTVID